MKKSVTLNGETNPEEVLQLPEGRLLVGKLCATFSPGAAVAAAKDLVSEYEHCQGERTFYSQAEVIAFASNEIGWNSDPEYRTF